MTEDELQKLAKVILTIDNGCSTCITRFCREFNAEFTDYNLELDEDVWPNKLKITKKE